MEHQDRTDKVKDDFKELSELYMFEELYKFIRESTGIAITIAYLALILSSMAYLFVLFNAFDISIVKYLTFEDILATPIKNPDIIIIFFAIVFVLYMTDLGNRFRARQQLKYANVEKKPFGFKIFQIVFWAPRKRKANIKVTAITVMLCLGVYIFSFATREAAKIKRGQGPQIAISVADEASISSTLLGTTINYVFTYNNVTEESVIYSVESIQSIKKITTLTESDIQEATDEATDGAVSESG